MYRTVQEYWDEVYRRPEPVFGYRPTRFVARNETWLAGASRVLVLGDGDGRHGTWLAYRGHSVVTVDFSSVGVAKAREMAAERGVEIEAHCAEIGQWIHTDAAQGPWDAIVSVRCTLPPETLHDVGQTLGPRIVPGGRLLLEELSGEVTPPVLDLPFPAAWLPTIDALRSAWSHLTLDTQSFNRHVREPDGRVAQRAMVQVLGVAPARRAPGQLFADSPSAPSLLTV